MQGLGMARAGEGGDFPRFGQNVCLLAKEKGEFA